MPADNHSWIARGQCVEHYGAGEPYLPILEALERLCRTAARERLLPVLCQYAPLWFAQLAEIVDPVEQAEQGLNALAEALAIVDKTGERFYEAELYRLKGQLTLQSAVHSRQSTVKESLGSSVENPQSAFRN